MLEFALPGTKRVTSPCGNCTNRAADCHGGCGAYKDYRKALDDVNGARNTKLIVECEYANYRRLAVKRIAERRHTIRE